MMKTIFRFMNRVYGRLIRHAVARNQIDALHEVPTELIPASGLHGYADYPKELGCSFRAELASHSRTWTTDPRRYSAPESVLDNKLHAFEFMSKLGVPPRIFQFGVTVSDLRLGPDMVVKPEDGFNSRGVFVFNSEGRAHDIGTNYKGLSPEDVKSRRQAYLASGDILRDRWHSEEPFLAEDGTPVPELKFLCFYGKCPIILKRKADPERVKIFQVVDRNNADLKSDAYVQYDLSYIELEPSDIELAEYISSHIPALFLRIDFLKDEELVFGEIGNIIVRFQRYGTELDRILGHAFIDVRKRLYADFIQGKTFEAFQEFLGTLGTQVKM